MASLSNRVEPIHPIPLTRTELTALGRFAVIFGQIDHYVTQILFHLAFVDTRAGYQMLENTTTGVKVGHLRKNLYRIRPKPLRAKTKSFIDDIGGLIERRNHMFHGLWGWYIAPMGVTRPACHYPKNSEPVFPNKIDEYANHAARLSCLIHEIFCEIMGTGHPPPHNPHPRFIFGGQEAYDEMLAKGIQTKLLGRAYEDHPDPDDKT